MKNFIHFASNFFLTLEYIKFWTNIPKMSVNSQFRNTYLGTTWVISRHSEMGSPLTSFIMFYFSLPVSLGCGATSSENCTYFESTSNSGTNAGACRMKLCKCSPDICQVSTTSGSKIRTNLRSWYFVPQCAEISVALVMPRRKIQFLSRTSGKIHCKTSEASVYNVFWSK